MNGALESPSTGSLIGRRWVFGNTILDERSLELLVQGEVVRLERRPLEVLLYLLQHADEVVTKDELAEELWPGRVLTESVLSRCVSLLRQALKDSKHTIIVTVHGYGYRFAANVRVETAPAASAPTLDFEVGDSPPLRPQWKLVERLGAGGHGEAWLACNEKTREARVFKFALDQEALSSLKREITLFRVINDSLGARAPVVALLEWNLEELPYFIETEYVEGRDLSSWVKARGGLPQIPLAVRLEIVAQIADALAAAHSVGVLHKDLKPGNVLVECDGNPRIKLGDFGCGGVLDPRRLESLGITQSGFSGTVDPRTAGTPLYMAPEILRGQPHTVRTDIYSLGVLLYQMVEGDLQRPFAPDWDHGVLDPLLREDIAATASGTPERRVASAANLAERLRSLEGRREARAAEAAAAERGHRSRKLMAELRRARIFAIALLALAAVAMAGATAAYRARGEAVRATDTSRAVSDFLMEDVLAVDPAAERPKDASYESLLGRAAAQVDSRFKNQPEAAASVHWLLGRRYQEIGQAHRAADHYERARTTLAELFGPGADGALLIAYRLAPMYLDRGEKTRGLALARQLKEDWMRRHGAADLSTFMVRIWVARILAFSGDYVAGQNELRTILRELPTAESPTEKTKGIIRQWLGITMIADVSALTSDRSWTEVVYAFAQNEYGSSLVEFTDQYTESLDSLRASYETFLRVLGEDSELTAEASLTLGYALGTLGKYEEAEQLTVKAMTFFNAWLPPTHWAVAIPKLCLGRLRLEQRRPDQATELLASALASCREHGCSPRITEEVAYDLGRAYQSLAKRDEAIRVLSDSLSAYEQLRGAGHVGSLRRRISLAETFREAGLTSMAEATLSKVSSGALKSLPPKHQVIADYRRLQGLLWLDSKLFGQAAAALEESAEITRERFGAGHWRTERARKELEKAQALLESQT